jgi:tRNA threonylcarbamoyladenosine biosynthesis protein TsaE
VTAPALPAAPGVVDLTELRSYGVALGAALRAPVVVTLTGDLGAGKTTLVQAIARGAGVTGDVTSPTFALVHEYAAPAQTIYHLDLYRLMNSDELDNIGWDEIVYGDGIVLIEWPERAGARLPSARLDVTLGEVPADDERRRVEARWTA